MSSCYQAAQNYLRQKINKLNSLAADLVVDGWAAQVTWEKGMLTLKVKARIKKKIDTGVSKI